MIPFFLSQIPDKHDTQFLSEKLSNGLSISWEKDNSSYQFNELVANLSSNKVRSATKAGKRYLVAPVTMIVPGVLNGSRGPLYYPADEIKRNPQSWNQIPLVVYHPYHPISGKQLSAKDPGVLKRQGIGFILKPTANGKLKAEAWFDIDKTNRVDARVMAALRSGTPLELSTGLYSDIESAPPGANYKGVAYTHVVRNMIPDHLAILPDEIGACSLNDGCGVLVNKKSIPSAQVGVSPDKACKIVKDGSVHGHPLSDKQKGMFGAICGKRKKKSNNSVQVTWSTLPTSEESPLITTNCTGMKKCEACSNKMKKVKDKYTIQWG